MAATLRTQFKIQGWQEMRRTFAELKKGVRNRVSKAALMAGGRIIAKNTKSITPVADADQTTRGIPVGPGRGLLKRSLGLRGKIKNGRAYVVVGPRRKMKMQIGVNKKGEPVYMNPTNYAHLMETGHVLKRGNKIVGRVAPTNFMRRGFEMSLGAAQAVIEQKFAEGIAREAAKAASKK